MKIVTRLFHYPRKAHSLLSLFLENSMNGIEHELREIDASINRLFAIWKLLDRPHVDELAAARDFLYREAEELADACNRMRQLAIARRERAA